MPPRHSPVTRVILDCGGRPLDLVAPRVMGILNVTPDSFSDGGRYDAVGRAVERGIEMVGEGAAIIDVGGESTRPGAEPVPEAEEIDRVVPVIERLAAEIPTPISIDTSKPAVMRAAVAAGAGFINDVNALRAPGALATAAALGVPVCLMHMQGEPRTMQQDPRYDDVVGEVRAFLLERAAAARAAGIPGASIVLDPGFGFGKRLAHNLALLKHLPALVETGHVVLAGLSRKSMIGALLDLPVDARLHPSVALAVLAAWQGARLLRVHDVQPTVEALAMVQAVNETE